MKKGYIKLHRQITEHWLWNNGEPFDKRSAWIDLLLMASWKSSVREFKGEIIEQRRGEVVTTIKALAARWGWSEGKVRRFLAALKTADMCTLRRRSHGMVLTIENYAFFQDERRTDGSSHGSSDGSSNGDNRRRDKEGNKETRAREGEPLVAPPTREEREEIERLLGMVVN